jgi:hypothetical protein
VLPSSNLRDLRIRGTFVAHGVTKAPGVLIRPPALWQKVRSARNP